MLTREHYLHFCPNAKEAYLSALTDKDWGVDQMNRFGILQSFERLGGFLANGFHETGGLTVIRESLRYTTAGRLKAVWPKRFGSKAYSELAPFLYDREHNPKADVALARQVYNGRMGNRPDTDDGFVYRGSGFLQITGRDAYLEFGQKCGFDFDAMPELVDDMRVMFALSCFEWWSSGNNERMDAGKFDEACAVLNTGNPKLIKATVGLDDRRRWYGKLMSWLKQNPDLDVGDPAGDGDQHPDGDTVGGQVAHWLEGIEDEDALV